jgi:DNA polymerase-3 subunit gamma/tau
VLPSTADDAAVADTERERAKDMASKLSMAVLARAWQMLLKGLGEVRDAPSDAHAAEMVLVRLAYAADMPTPGDLVAKLDAGRSGPAPSPAAVAGGGAAPAYAEAPAAKPGPASQAQSQPMPRSFEEAVALFAEKREMILHTHLQGDVHLVRFEPGKIEFRASPTAPPDLAHRIGERLSAWTGRGWVVGLSNEAGAPTMREVRTAKEQARRAGALSHPLVKAAMDTFPGATVEAVRENTQPPPIDDDEPLPEDIPGDDEP